MALEVKAIIECENCHTKNDTESLFCDYVCEDCRLKEQNELVKLAIEELIHKKYIWEEKESYIGFKSEDERELYCSGVKRGYIVALFWLADYFNIVEDFEKIVEKYKCE